MKKRNSTNMILVRYTSDAYTDIDGKKTHSAQMLLVSIRERPTGANKRYCCSCGSSRRCPCIIQDFASVLKKLTRAAFGSSVSAGEALMDTTQPALILVFASLVRYTLRMQTKPEFKATRLSSPPLITPK